MLSFFSSAFNGLASLFSSPPAAPTLPPPSFATPTGPVAPPDTFAAGMAGIAEGPVTQAPPVPAPVQAGPSPSWLKIALAVLNVALTKPGQDRRRDAVRRAINGLGAGAVVLGVLAAGAAPQPVSAQSADAQPGVCAQRAKIVERLHAKYGESRQGVGIAQGQRVVEIWASDDSGSWSIIVTLPDGSSCLIAAGEDWEALDAPMPAAGRDA